MPVSPSVDRSTLMFPGLQLIKILDIWPSVQRQTSDCEATVAKQAIW